MDTTRFDSLTRALGHATSRRASIPLFGSLLALLSPGVGPTFAKKKNKNKKKKATLCLDGQTIQAKKKKKKKLLKSGATAGACPPVCTPNCPGTACGADDGCGGACGCAAGSVCHEGTCHACTVACGSNGAICGDALRNALAGGGIVFACPGRYTGNITFTKPVTLVGAGDGADPGNSTILDAAQSGLPIFVNENVAVDIHHLRVTGGKEEILHGGGVFNKGTLSMSHCTIAGNTATGAGGGIYQVSDTGPLTLRNCVISGNKAEIWGGGIGASSPHGMLLFGCLIEGNESASVGGGIATFEGTATLDSACRIQGNTATDGGGVHRGGTGTVNLNGAAVSNNSPNNCSGLTC